MAETYKRICIKYYTLTAENGDTFTVKRGTEYLTSAERQNGDVTVFCSYWVSIPINVFAKDMNE